MKTILKNTLKAGALCLSMSMPSFASSDDEVMLVVTKSGIVSAQSKNGQPNVSPSQSVTVPLNGRTADDVIAEMRRSGEYVTVERDVIVRSIFPSSTLTLPPFAVAAQNEGDEPNDELFSDQRSLFEDNIKGENAGSNILSAWAALGSDIDNDVTVVVLDSGFFDHEDVNYHVGLNHIDDDRTDPYDFKPAEGQEICSAHGLGTSSVIAANINNETSMAGIVPNVKIHAGRVMDCGVGRLSSTARALDAYAFGNVAEHNGETLIFNLSLGGALSYCPLFMQEAIDRVVKLGHKVVVAAGNEGYDVDGWTPSNCANVITVGATDDHGEQTHFSNYGDKVDISAQGKWVVGACKDNQTCYWNGTSFAAPVVSGVLALVEKAGGIDVNMVERVMSATAFSLDGQCSHGECGAGLINAEGLVEAAQLNATGELNTIRHALADKNECDQKWYIDNFGDSARLCEMFKVSFLGGYVSKSLSFKLYRHLPGNDDTLAYEFVGEFEGGKSLLKEFSNQYEYKFLICEDGECDTEWFDVNTEKAVTPTACL